VLFFAIFTFWLQKWHVLKPDRNNRNETTETTGTKPPEPPEQESEKTETTETKIEHGILIDLPLWGAISAKII
jgi:hypothetical protein